ncbi:MAG: hypothetical protein KDH96_00360 [Candidatus Riesia sp.]|nr:hypothetical protein [Candidatus Riesia sp.]
MLLNRIEDLVIDWMQILEAVGTAFGLAIFGSLTQLYKKHKQLKKKKRTLEAHTETQKAIVEIYSIIDTILKNTKADCAYIFHSHNGDGLPNIGKPYKVSALYGTNLVSEDTKNRYQNIVVDERYTRMLLEVFEKKGKYVFDVKNEPPGYLKNVYLSEGVQHSIIYFIAVKETGVVFMSVSTHDEEFFTEKGLALIETEINRIKAIFNE